MAGTKQEEVGRVGQRQNGPLSVLSTLARTLGAESILVLFFRISRKEFGSMTPTVGMREWKVKGQSWSQQHKPHLVVHPWVRSTEGQGPGAQNVGEVVS